MLRTRFAPSPTGLLHVGNGLSALLCQQWANKHQAACLLRIEDIDHTRCRAHYIQAIRDDLQWLGLHWSDEAARQSQRLNRYKIALNTLKRLSVLYPCFCTQADFRRAPSSIVRPWHCPHYCAKISNTLQKQRIQHEAHTWRLHCHAAWQQVSPQLTWQDDHGNHHLVIDDLQYDPIVGRKDIQYSYHLAVVIDDAEQQISHVIRGTDLCHSTAIHRLLQALLNLPSPIYHHHPLLKNDHGERLAKQYSSISLCELRHAGVHPSKLRDYLLNTKNPIWPPQDSVTQLTQMA